MRSSLVALSVTCILVLGGGASARAGTIFSFQFDNTPWTRRSHAHRGDGEVHVR